MQPKVGDYYEIAKYLREALSGGENADSILFFLALIALLFIFALIHSLWYSRRPVPIASTKDLDFFETVIQEKGLEDFDRDFLLDIAETHHVKPIYKVLLEVQVFERVLRKLEAEIHRNRNSEGMDAPMRLDYLRRLRKRLFHDS